MVIREWIPHYLPLQMIVLPRYTNGGLFVNILFITMGAITLKSVFNLYILFIYIYYYVATNSLL